MPVFRKNLAGPRPVQVDRTGGTTDQKRKPKSPFHLRDLAGGEETRFVVWLPAAGQSERVFSGWVFLCLERPGHAGVLGTERPKKQKPGKSLHSRGLAGTEGTGTALPVRVPWKGKVKGLAWAGPFAFLERC